MAFPIATIVRPAALAGQTNGQLDDAVLRTIDGLDGGPKLRLVKVAALAWIAMAAAALAEGVVLKATSAADSYRVYAIQERIFRERYTTTVLAGRPSRMWNGVRWYQRPGTAAAAVPGTSNHGWAMAIDVVLGPGVLGWLLEHAGRFGFSWELQSEAWHIRYVAGDRIPEAVAAHTGHTQPPTEEDLFMAALTHDEQHELLEGVRTLVWPAGTPPEARHPLYNLALWTLQKVGADQVDEQAIAAAVIAGLPPAVVAEALTRADMVDAVKQAWREGTG
jgi:hypothetical protein